MKLSYALLFFSALQLSFTNAGKLNPRHRDLRMKRQAPQANSSPTPTTPPLNHSPPQSPSPPSTPNQPPTTTPPFPSVPGAPTTTTTSSSNSSGSGLPTVTVISGSTITINATTSSTIKGPPPLDTGTAIPPLANITLGMATQNPLPVSSTYAPGATPPNSGAPVLPTPCKCYLL